MKLHSDNKLKPITTIEIAMGNVHINIFFQISVIIFLTKLTFKLAL